MFKAFNIPFSFITSFFVVDTVILMTASHLFGFASMHIYVRSKPKKIVSFDLQGTFFWTEPYVVLLNSLLHAREMLIMYLILIGLYDHAIHRDL